MNESGSNSTRSHGSAESSRKRKRKVSRNTTPPLGTCCHASFNGTEVFTILTRRMTGVLHVYVNLSWAGEPMVGVAERDPAMVVLATEVRAWACKGGMVIGSAKVTRGVGACGLVVPPDMAVATERDLILGSIVVWGRKGVCKLPILIW
jgi:hypothetical protein